MRREVGVLGIATLLLSVVLLTGIVTTGCSSQSSSSSTTAVSRPAPSTTRTTTPSTTTPTAATGLAAYFSAATGLDQRLQVARAAANGAIGTTAITVSQSTIDAINAADPSAAAREIPAGLPEGVLLPVLTVQSDLTSRFFAFRGFVNADPGVIPRARPTPGSMSAADYLLTCLGNGSKAAGSFAR